MTQILYIIRSILSRFFQRAICHEVFHPIRIQYIQRPCIQIPTLRNSDCDFHEIIIDNEFFDVLNGIITGVYTDVIRGSQDHIDILSVFRVIVGMFAFHVGYVAISDIDGSIGRNAQIQSRYNIRFDLSDLYGFIIRRRHRPNLPGESKDRPQDRAALLLQGCL